MLIFPATLKTLALTFRTSAIINKDTMDYVSRSNSSGSFEKHFWGSSSESGLISEEWPLAQKQWGPPPHQVLGECGTDGEARGANPRGPAELGRTPLRLADSPNFRHLISKQGTCTYAFNV